MKTRFKIGDEVWIRTKVVRVPTEQYTYRLEIDEWIYINMAADQLNAATIPEGWTMTTIKKLP